MGTKLNKNYMVVAESGALADILIFDKTRMSITTLKNGVFKDITDNCKKLTKRKQKVVGGLWYQFLHNEVDSSSACIACIWEDKIMFHTDNENEVDMFLLETRVKQLKFMLENAETHSLRYQNGKRVKQLKFMLENAETHSLRYQNGKQAYTYKFIEKEV